MTSRGHDGDAMPPMPGPPMGSGIEMPLGQINMEALAPTMIVMQNLPAIASFASSLAAFVLTEDLTGIMRVWMTGEICEKHRGEIDLDDLPRVLEGYKKVLDNYLDALGFTGDGCSHD